MGVPRINTKTILQFLILSCWLVSSIGPDVSVCMGAGPVWDGGAAFDSIEDGYLFFVQNPKPGMPVWKEVRDVGHQSPFTGLPTPRFYGPGFTFLSIEDRVLPDRKEHQLLRTGHWARPPPLV